MKFESSFLLTQAFFAPWRVVYEGGVDPLLRGLFTVPAKLKKSDQNLNSELTERLFTTFHAVSLDLAAMNIQRGRDHAIHSYMNYRKICNLTTSDNFEGLVDIRDSAVREKLKKLYGHVSNIDLWVGGILEDQIAGAKVGPLFRCILIEQFKNLRDGDRFYYENPSIFTPEQLVEIKQTSLAQVLCNNGDNITRVTENPFILPALQGGYKNCDEIPMISLRIWTDCSDCSKRAAHNLDIRSFPRRSNRNRRDVKLMMENVKNSVEHDDESEEEVHFNIDNDFYDMNEQRIEGLEQLIENFQRTLKKQRKEIKRLKASNEDILRVINITNFKQLQDEMNNEVVVKSSSKHHFRCTDNKGISRLNNEIWMQDDCTNCICQHHQITCTIEKCAEEPPKCEKGYVLGKKNGQCCASCMKEEKHEDQIDDTTIMSKVTRNR
jgi:peroxidase